MSVPTTPATPTTTPAPTTPDLQTPNPIPGTLPPSSDPVVPPAAPVEPAVPAAPVAPVAPVEPVVPEEYEIDVDEATPLSEAELQSIADYASKHSLSKEEAQALVTTQEGLYTKGKTAAETAQGEVLKARQHAFNTHPEFSGEKKAGSFQSISLAVNTFGTPAMIAKLKDPEHGYDIEMALFLKNLGDTMRPEAFVPGGTSVPVTPVDAPESERARLKRLYPALNWDDKK